MLVIAGNDRGKVGEVMGRKNDRILVQGVNVRKKHLKSRDQNRKSEVIDMELPIHISNVALCGADKRKLKLFVRGGKDSDKTLAGVIDGKETCYRTLRKLLKH